MTTRTNKTRVARKRRPAAALGKAKALNFGLGDKIVIPDPIVPGPLGPPPKTAIVIVVEENEAQGYSVTWADIFKASSRIMNLGLGDLDLDLPGWLRDLIRKSGKVTDKVMEGVRAGFTGMLDEIMGETRKALSNGSASNLDTLLKTLPQRLVIPNGIKAFFNEYGETGYAEILRAMAAPYYAKVVVLTDRAATFANFKSTLEGLHSEGYRIDLLLDLHGCGDSSQLNNGCCNDDHLVFTDKDATVADIKSIGGGKKLNLNAVYMVSCWGARFNDVWVNALGAKASNGANELNYYVLLSPFAFMHAWTTGGMTLTAASQFAYDVERVLLNGKAFKASITVGRNPITGEKIKWSASLGVTWQKLMNKQLSQFKGEDKRKPVDNVASSKRVPCGDTRRA